LARRGVLLGLSARQLTVLGVGAVILVAALYGGGTGWATYTAPAWITCALTAWIHVGGRNLTDWAPIAARYALRALRGQLVFRKHLPAPRRQGMLALPGDAAALTYYSDPTSGTVMVHDPHQATLTAICEVTHPAFVLLDPADQHARVSGWSRVLATCCRSGRIARLQITERIIPDAGAGLADWWAHHGTDDGSWAARIYTDLVHRAGPAGEHHTTTISLALDMKTARRAIRTAGSGLAGAATVLRQEMTTLASALRTAQLIPTRWWDASQLAACLRGAYDPAATTILDHHPGVGRDLDQAGPIGVRETWDRLTTDTGVHTVLWISEWPRTTVLPDFLAPLVLTGGVRRVLTILAEPLRPDKAARDLRKKKTEHVSDQAQRRRIGQIEDAAQQAEYADVLAQEQDLAAGHGIVRYTGLIAVTAPTDQALDAAVATIEQAAIQASLETRRLVGQQAQAFTTAALPLARPA
jgi:hypothetical protein